MNFGMGAMKNCAISPHLVSYVALDENLGEKIRERWHSLLIKISINLPKFLMRTFSAHIFVYNVNCVRIHGKKNIKFLA